MKKIKKYIVLSFALTLLLLFTAGCGKKSEPALYQQYVKSLIAMNYLGATSDYIAATAKNISF